MNSSSQSTQHSSMSMSQKTSKKNVWSINDSNSDTSVDHCASKDDKMLLARIQDLVEYYFRPLNRSSYITAKLKEGDDFVSLDVILSFSQMQQLCEEAQAKGSSARALLQRALVDSEFVALSKDGLSVGPTQIEDKQLLCRLRKQVEYYFSPQNLTNDRYLNERLEEGDGTVPLSLLCKFNRIRKIHAVGCLGMPSNLKPNDYPPANPAVLRRALQGCKYLTVTEFYYRVGPGQAMGKARAQKPVRRRAITLFDFVVAGL